MRNVPLGILTFSTLGPLAGGITVWLILMKPFFLTSLGNGAIGSLQALVGVLFFSYFFGIVPAAITGFAAGAFRAKLNSASMLLLIGAIGAVTSTAFMVMLTWSRTNTSGMFSDLFLMIPVAGFSGGTIVAAFFRPKSKPED